MTAPNNYDGFGTFSPKVRSYSVVRKQVSQGSAGALGLRVVGPNAVPTPATNVSMKLWLDEDFDETNNFEDEDPYGVVIAEFAPTDVITESEGVYSVALTAEHTARRGNLAAVWSYTVNGMNLTYTDQVQITEYMPEFENLRDFEQDIVEQVAWMFADLFDSTNGGPNLTEQFQTHFGHNRIAQLMGQAVYWFNITGVPMTKFGVGNGTTRVPAGYTGLLVIGTYMEVLKHFVRTYVEQPDFKNMTVTYTDRAQYMQRWQQVYQMEKADYDKALKLAKRKFLSLGSGSLLVAGGIYGSSSRYFRSGMYAAQTRAGRFYPAAPVAAIAG